MLALVVSVAIAAAILLVAAPAASEETADPKRSEENRPGLVISRIEWHGVKAIDTDDLEDRILTTSEPRFKFRFWHPKRRLEAFILEEDRERLLEAYHEIGYFGAEVQSRIEGLQGYRAAIHFDVVEGEPVTLEAWTLDLEEESGEPIPLEADERARLAALLPEVTGQPFGSKMYRERREALIEACGELGYPIAKLVGGAQVDPGVGTAHIDWTLRLGPRTLVRSIRIEGLRSVDEEIIRRELSLKENDRFSATKLEQSERRLVETGLFRSVAIGRGRGEAPKNETELETEAAPLPKDRIDLVVRVDESPPRSLRASIGYGTEDGPRGEISLGWRNFTGHARHLQIRAFGSFLDAGFETSLAQPYVWDERARADFAVSALRQSRPGYEAFVTEGALLFTFYPGRDREGPFTLTTGPAAEFARILDFEIDTDDRLRGPRQAITTHWTTIARYQDVDHPLNPRSGVRFKLGNEIGGHPIGSELDYHRWDADLRFYIPTGPLVWAFKAAATTLDPIGQSIRSVPLTRRLYSGGTNSVRGFGFQKLGPEDGRNDPIGGLSRIEFGGELRIPVWRRFGLVGFVDAGDVRTASWSFRPKDLRAAAGPGLRIETPVGPLRFDFAFLLNRPANTDPWRFHLSVGNAF